MALEDPDLALVQALQAGEDPALNTLIERLKSFLFFQAQAELLVNPFMATDSELRAQRSKHSGANVTCSGSNEGYDDEHRDELQRLVHRDWLKRVEGNVGASDANTSNPRGL